MTMTDDIKKKIADLLSSDDPDVRRRAAEDLGVQRGLAAIAGLAAALKDANKGVRDAAAHALLTMGGANVARAIVEYIADDNIVSRNLAGELLRQLGGASVPALLPYLQDGSCDVRKFAVDLLGSVGSSSIATEVVPLLEDPDQNVVDSAVEALGNLGNPEAAPHLINAYRQHEYTRATAVEALGKVGGPQAAEFLLLAFNKKISEQPADPVVLCAIIESLGLVGDEHALIVMKHFVQKVHGKPRNALIHAIVRVSERTHRAIELPGIQVKDLLDALADSDPGIKSSAATCLASFAGEEVTMALLHSFAVSDELDNLLYELLEQRADALGCTVVLLTEHAMPVIQGVKIVGRLANRAIERILRHEWLTVDDFMLARAFDVVAAEWQEADEDLRTFIVDTLFRLDGDKTIGFLDVLMEDPDPWLRVHLIELLAAIGDRRVPAFVNRFLDDEDEMVREVAGTTLQSLLPAVNGQAMNIQGM